MIAVGTCGYSYRDWIGPVYPPGTASGEMLRLYARRFPIVEIDSSYYRVPSRTTFESMARRTPDDFRFTAKLPSTGTHLPLDAGAGIHDDIALFRRNLEPLISSGKFACALMQFPNAFHPSEAAHAYLRALRETLDDIRLVAEFRNRAWQTDDTLQLLRELGVGLVNVDMPQYESLMRPSADVTGEIAYVRFHGRNYAQWWKGTNETRYDYSYSAEELGPWADRLVDMAANPDVKEVLGFFNNHRRGQAVKNAELFEAMLATRFPPGSVKRSEPSEPVPEALTLDFDEAPESE